MQSDLVAFDKSNSKRKTNRFILKMDCKISIVFITWIEFLYKLRKNFEIKGSRFFGENLGERKIEYGIKGRFFLSFLARKIEFC